MKTSKLLVLALCLFSYSLAGFGKTIVISDIDDTIKKANTMGGIGGVWHFLRKKPYEETRDLFNEIKKFEMNQGEEINYYYVSAAPSYTFDGDEWILKNRFPVGPVVLKTKENGGETYDYKYRTIKNIIIKELFSDPDLKIYFFGDNSQHDARVYYDLRKDMGLTNTMIFIRDVSTEATWFADDLPVKRLDDVDYFFSEVELLDHPKFSFMSLSLRRSISGMYQQKALIPGYTFDTMVDRLKAICKDDKEMCRTTAKRKANIYWNDYYTRY